MGRNSFDAYFERHGRVLGVGEFFAYRGWIYKVTSAPDVPGGKWCEVAGRAASGNDAFGASEIAEGLNLLRVTRIAAGRDPENGVKNQPTKETP